MEDGAKLSHLQGFRFQSSSAFPGGCRISQNPFLCLPFNRTLGFINVQKRKSQPSALSFQSFCH